MDILNGIKEHPVRFAHMVGFDRLTETHNIWLRRIICGRDDWTLQAFRGSYKTTTVSVALALLLIVKPNMRIAFMRKTDNDAKEVIAQIQRMLGRAEAGALSDMIWGHRVRLVKSSQTEITTNLTNDPRGAAQLSGMGINGSLTGKHFDLIFTDDIVNPKDRFSRAEREHTKTVYMELQNIRNRGGRIINTGTPWHVDDCFSIMPEAEKWDWRSMPDVFTESDAEKIRPRMTQSLWAANYELRHIPSDDVIFTSPKTGADPAFLANGECHVDAAYYGEDYTAFTAMRYLDGKIYTYGRLWRKNVLDVLDEIKEDHSRLRLGRLYIETNPDKGYAAEAIRAKGITVVPYPEAENKHAKIVTHLKASWPEIVFATGTDDAYISQICDYTEDAEHDDAPDSAASLLVRGRIKKAKAASTLYM